ncbi:1-phosphofructokinase [Clostridium tyrobutyricum]|jgi:1-phosphofructokinase|uniref:Tagatose-6-phosphate kinase n=1 Tax=Clostridium tyrobutyricum DIVETGP TaxID=1408889 RepID=W6NKB9_CLOTY|nr:1-phosphofructokinase [Clostridium tyrobutyricum]AND83894.1 1-phosphofructokinase [Clostridium tyrobutyricum]ANP68640.1 1-phosphofructokinase [Clostridium tyrobutyricum]MBR9648566.1 1-phosphofructokinase [Clostridium tyrobutyricum]MBV4415357.1 1-phosphofructokinase [Clostridium tyrobutyricum]MBV4422742.1 1-phosphofructokinase [Clostridium tyrobutyricum]
MIYTVTFNPSIDYVIQTENLILGDINRVDNEKKFAGGKGINVSRVLNNLGVSSKALGFIGGFTGKFIKDSLVNLGIFTDFIEVKEDTRINVKIKSKQETEINGAGPDIDKENLEKLFKKVENLKSEDFIVLAGNVQKSVPRDIYSRIQQRCKNGKVAVDTTGSALTATLKYKPFLIKPNIHELGEIFERELKSSDEVIKYANELRKMGAQNVIISMGKDGAMLVCDEGVYKASAPKGTVKNSVGAGDSVVAGFLAEYTRSHSIVDAFKYGAASGSATAFSIDLCKKAFVEQLMAEINVTKL